MIFESIPGHEWPHFCRSDILAIELVLESLFGISPYPNMRCSLDSAVRQPAHGDKLACLHTASCHMLSDKTAQLGYPVCILRLSVPQKRQYLFFLPLVP